MIAPMLCFDAKGDLEVVPRDGRWIMEPKLDGWRWQVHVTSEGVRSYGGRNGADHTGKAAPIERALASLPPGTVLDGEIAPCAHGLQAPAVGSLLACGGDGLVFVVFDVLRVMGRDVMHEPWSERRAYVELCVATVRELAHDDVVQASTITEVDDAVFARWIGLGFEGCVAKRTDSSYRPGKRSRDWLKVKPQASAEATVTGWVAGKGQGNKQRCGALRIRLLDGDVETTCGYDATPAEADAMVGRIIEFRHHGIMASGKPRHPVYFRLREDREPPPCPNQLAAGRIHGVEEVVAAEREQERRGIGKDRPTAAGTWLRNYGAMGDAKLLKVLAELESGDENTDAVRRVLARQGSVEHNAATARRVAESRGLVAD